MNTILLALLLAAPGPIIVPPNPGGNVAGADLKNVDDFYQDELTSDTAPRVGVEKYQNAYPMATVNPTGANHVEAAGMGVRYATVVDVANMAGEIVRVSVSAQGVVTSVDKTEGVASPNGWPACAALTAAQCACGLYDLLNGAGAIPGVYVLRTDATCSDAKVFYGCTPGECEMLSIAITSGGTVGMTATQGADGLVVLPAGRTRYETPGSVGTGGILVGTSGGVSVRNYTDTADGNTRLNVLYPAQVSQVSAKWGLSTTAITIASDVGVQFSSTTLSTGGKDVGIYRASAGLLGITDGSSTVVQVANYGRLGSVTIDTSSLVAQTLFTVPAGRVAYPQRVVVRDPSAAITVAAGGFGFDANCTDWLTGAALTVLTGATSSAAWSPANGALTVEGPAAGVFCFKTSAQEAAADTVVVDVYGVLQ